MNRKELLAFVESLKKMRESATEQQSAEAPAVYPTWKENIDYVVGDRVLYKEVLYKVLQSHTPQYGWRPTDAPSLFAQVLIPDMNVIQEWVQPDSTNPYMKGDKVTYSGNTWVSTVDNNVWMPSVYGWKEV